MATAVAASSSLSTPHDRSRSDSHDFNTLSRTPTPVSANRSATKEPLPTTSPHHPDLSSELAALSTKLINAINHNTNLDDSLQSTRSELESARQEIASLRNRIQDERQQKLHAERERRKVEGELETLTSSLFEEANSMVASARREHQESEDRNEQMKSQLQDAETLLESHQEQLRELKDVLQHIEDERPSSEPSTYTSTPSTPIIDSARNISTTAEQMDSANDRPGTLLLQPDTPLSFSNLIFPVLRHDLQSYEDFVSMLEAGQKTAPSSRTNSGQFAGLNVMNIGSLTNLKQSTIIKSQLNQNIQNSSLTSSAPSPQNLSGSYNPNSPTDMATSPAIASSLKDQKFYKRALLEDIEPTLRLDAAPGLSYFSRRNIVSSMASGSLVVEPFGPAQRYWSPSFSCALCGESRQGKPYIRKHRFRTSDSDEAQRYQVCDYCLNRLRATGDFVNFMRMVRSGYWKNDNPDDPKIAWEECIKLRERMFWARLGGGVVPSVPISDVTPLVPRRPRNIMTEKPPSEADEDAVNGESSRSSQASESSQHSPKSKSSASNSLDKPIYPIESGSKASETEEISEGAVRAPQTQEGSGRPQAQGAQEPLDQRPKSPIRASPAASPSPAVRRPLSSSSGNGPSGSNKFLAARSRFEAAESSTSPERASGFRRPSNLSPERRGSQVSDSGPSPGTDEAITPTAPLGSPKRTQRLPGSFELHLRRSLLRALPAPASFSYLATARNSRSFVTVINKAQNQSSFSSLSRPQRAANLASTLRRSYATQDEESKKEESTFESAKESVEDTAESVQESAKETAAQGAERAQDGADSSMAAVRDAFESVKDAGRSAAGYVTDAADSFAEPGQSSPFSKERGTAGSREGAESTNLYLGNLYFEVDSERLQKEFEQFGEVKRVAVIKDARGLSKGFAYVEFQDQTAASNARNAFNGEVFEGRRMVVQYALKSAKGPPRQSFHNGEAGFRNPPSKTLYIGNMSFEMSDTDLNGLFREIKNVLDVRVAIDRRTGQPRGFAHADFIDVKSAEAAAELLQAKEFYGRKLRIDFSTAANAERT